MIKLKTIKLYRSWKYKIIHFLLMILILLVVCVSIFALIKTGFHEFFFGYRGRALQGIEFPMGCMMIINYFVNIILGIFISFICFVSVFYNRIIVYNTHLLFIFAPRVVTRLHKKDICKISRASVNEIPIYQRILNYNLERNYLYKFSCYDMEFIISSKDEASINELMNEINPMNNITEKDEEDYDPYKLTKIDKYSLIIIGLYILSFAQSIFD